jgi:hypothetical protein
VSTARLLWPVAGFCYLGASRGRTDLPQQTCLIVATAVGVALAGGTAQSGGEPRHAFRPADQALAKSIRLKLSDLPRGFTAYRPADLEPGALGPHCKGTPDESDLTLTGKSFSPLFRSTDTDAGLYSGVSVFPSAGQARTALQREMRPAIARCFARWTISFFAGVSPVVLSSQSLRPLPGQGTQAVALRQVFKFVRPPTDSFAEDVIVLRKGRVESWLSGHFGARLQTRFALEQRLLAKLAARTP